MSRLSKIAATLLVLFCLCTPAVFAEEPEETNDQGVVASVLESLQELLVIINQGVMLPPNGEPGQQGG